MQKQFIQGLQTGFGMANLAAMHHAPPFSSAPPSANMNRSSDKGSGSSQPPSAARMDKAFDGDMPSASFPIISVDMLTS
eukprot:13242-Pleurochrysis_carterae.AAC.1